MTFFKQFRWAFVPLIAFGFLAEPAPVFAASGGAGADKVKRSKKSRKVRRSGGLAGQKGRTRGWHRATGGCKKIQKRYIAASGHSAYAATTARQYQQSICGAALNRASAAQAEAAALASCRRGTKKWKVGASKNCVIYMSK